MTVKLEEAPDLLTVTEVSRLLRLGRNQTYLLIAQKKIHSIRLGRSIRCPKASLVRLIDRAEEIE